MLRYTINTKDAIEELKNIQLLTYSTNILGYGNNDAIEIECTPLTKDDICYVNEKLSVTLVTNIINDADNDGDLSDIQTLDVKVTTSNSETGNFTFIAPSYRALEVRSVSEIENEYGEVFLEFYFSNGHFFKYDDEIILYVTYGVTNYEQVVLSDLVYVDCKTLRWKMKNEIETYNTLSNIIFQQSGTLIEKITVLRNQNMFPLDYDYDIETAPTITVIRPKVHIDIPISTKIGTDILQDSQIDDFVTSEVAKAIPSNIEMEKNIYTPIICGTGNHSKKTNISKINFNLHFRLHSGDNWTVQNTDDWNFSHYGYNRAHDSYYSYTSAEQSNQSDLLGYVGFTNTDVVYQKNRLQKSFLRLSYYTSQDVSNQELVGTSTIFFNTSKLYSKYMKGQLMDGWYVNEFDTSTKYDRISTGFELDTKSSHSKIPIKIKSDNEKIEEYRLSTQLSVQDKYSSNMSSEGFYLYLWATDKTAVPEHLYMKAEFNHAGYGRTIPMMAPYFIIGVDSIPTGRSNLFKTNQDIKDDWTYSGYGIKRFNEYSYIKLCYLYDSELKRFVYYIDPDVYGQLNGPILNINLYEARLTY